MTSRTTTALGVAIAPIALVLPLTACTPSAPASVPSSAPSSAAGAGTLEFTTVEQVTAPILQKDPNCGFGQWNDNSTGVPEEFRSGVKMFKQFDCYANENAVGGLPKRGQQSIFVEFGDDATADKYAESQKSLYSSLVAGSRVVVAGTGLETVDMKAYLGDLKNACGCGEILESGT